MQLKTVINAFAPTIMDIPELAAASTWEIDPVHSEVGFKVAHLMVSSVKGNFNTYSGIVTLNDSDMTKSTVDVTIEVSSINTDEPKRDDDLRSADFLDAVRYPTITYVSTKWTGTANGAMTIAGNLTMHGITREVVLDVEPFSKEVKDPTGKTRRGTSASTIINRKDFGLAWHQLLEFGGVMVGDDVAVSIKVEMVKIQPK
jgi:polyisoprenoid-binding protein YceI